MHSFVHAFSPPTMNICYDPDYLLDAKNTVTVQMSIVQNVARDRKFQENGFPFLQVFSVQPQMGMGVGKRSFPILVS